MYFFALLYTKIAPWQMYCTHFWDSVTILFYFCLGIFMAWCQCYAGVQPGRRRRTDAGRHPAAGRRLPSAAPDHLQALLQHQATIMRSPALWSAAMQQQAAQQLMQQQHAAAAAVLSVGGGKPLAPATALPPQTAARRPPLAPGLLVIWPGNGGQNYFR